MKDVKLSILHRQSCLILSGVVALGDGVRKNEGWVVHDRNIDRAAHPAESDDGCAAGLCTNPLFEMLILSDLFRLS